MAHNERQTLQTENGISLQESRPVENAQQRPNDMEQAATNLESAELRQQELKRIRLAVLLGSAILQLPIWGILVLHSIVTIN